MQQAGQSTCYTLATYIEIAGRYTLDSFEHRKQAAQAIIDIGATQLPGPEIYLTRDVFGFALKGCGVRSRRDCRRQSVLQRSGRHRGRG